MSKKGELRYGGNLFLIINLSSLELIDTLWSYRYSVSKDNRYIAFIEHYPRSLPSGAFGKDVILLYDMDKSPQQNRIENNGKLSTRKCGIPIFPEKNMSEKDYTNIVYQEIENNVVSSEIYWLDNIKIIFNEKEQIEFYRRHNERARSYFKNRIEEIKKYD